MRLVALSGLGKFANHQRPIRSGKEYDQYFDLTGVGNTTTLISRSADQFRTLREMRKLVKSTLHQTKRLAPVLKRNTLEDTLRAVWQFVYRHIQYKPDTAGQEELRTPARTWKDRQRGVDCDCYSIFISSILTNLGIAHAFRMAAYSGDWQHVYVVVPRNQSTGKISDARSSYYVLDAVADAFDNEFPFTKKYDYPMPTPLSVLSGHCSRSGGGPQVENPPPLRTQGGKRLPRPIEVRKAQLNKDGKVLTAEVLSAAGIGYEKIASADTGETAIAVKVGDKTAKLPPIIPKTQAAPIVEAIRNPNLLLNNRATMASSKVLVLIIALVLGGALLSGQDSVAKKKAPARKPPVIDIRANK